MGKSRIKTRTAYFVVTPEGKLKKLNPMLLGAFLVILIVSAVAVANRCYAFNRQLMAERVEISSSLLKMNSERSKLGSALNVCEEKMTEISNLLGFTTDSENKAQAGKADE